MQSERKDINYEAIKQAFARLPALSPAQQTDGRSYLVGTDPVIEEQYFLPYQRAGQRSILLATSTFRPLLLACQLSKNAPPAITCLIDNSKVVLQLMSDVKEMIGQHDNAMDFLNALYAYIKKAGHPWYPIKYVGRLDKRIKYHEQNYMYFFVHLFQQYGFDFVKEVLNNIILLAQSWESEATFNQIKSLLDHHQVPRQDVFMYVSDIVTARMRPSNADRVLRNIQHVNPALAIHTSICFFHMISEEVFYVEDHNNPKSLKKKLTDAGYRDGSLALFYAEKSLTPLKLLCLMGALLYGLTYSSLLLPAILLSIATIIHFSPLKSFITTNIRRVVANRNFHSVISNSSVAFFPPASVSAVETDAPQCSAFACK